MAKKTGFTSNQKKMAVIAVCFGTSAYIIINMFFIPKTVDPATREKMNASIENLLIPPNLTAEQYQERRKKYQDLKDKEKAEGKPENPMYDRMIKALDNSDVGKKFLAENGGATGVSGVPPKGPKPAIDASKNAAIVDSALPTSAPNSDIVAEASAENPPTEAAPTGEPEASSDDSEKNAEKGEAEVESKDEKAPEVEKTLPDANKVPALKGVTSALQYVQSKSGWDHGWELRLPIEVVRSRNLTVQAIFKVNSKTAKIETLFTADNIKKSKSEGFINISVNLNELVSKNEKDQLVVATAIMVRDDEKDYIFRRGINIGNENSMKLKNLEKKANLSDKKSLFSFANEKGNVELIIEIKFQK